MSHRTPGVRPRTTRFFSVPFRWQKKKPFVVVEDYLFVLLHLYLRGLSLSLLAIAGSSLKRSRTDFHSPSANGQDLHIVVQQQSQEIASLKQEKATLETNVNELRSENEKVVNENKILKKAVTIQQERQNHAASELEKANNYKLEAEDRMRKLEQMILTLRYHLSAQQSHNTPINDFMGFPPRPPDVH